jgi:hypothetical protein
VLGHAGGPRREVWNEPNLEFFGRGTQGDCFTLYSHSAQAIKAIDAELRAGAMPGYSTAWSAASNPRDPLHDERRAAALAIKPDTEATDLV